jgi:hypothetical protein
MDKLLHGSPAFSFSISLFYHTRRDANHKTFAWWEKVMREGLGLQERMGEFSK